MDDIDVDAVIRSQIKTIRNEIISKIPKVPSFTDITLSPVETRINDASLDPTSWKELDDILNGYYPNGRVEIHGWDREKGIRICRYALGAIGLMIWPEDKESEEWNDCGFTMLMWVKKFRKALLNVLEPAPQPPSVPQQPSFSPDPISRNPPRPPPILISRDTISPGSFLPLTDPSSLHADSPPIFSAFPTVSQIDLEGKRKGVEEASVDTDPSDVSPSPDHAPSPSTSKRVSRNEGAVSSSMIIGRSRSKSIGSGSNKGGKRRKSETLTDFELMALESSSKTRPKKRKLDSDESLTQTKVLREVIGEVTRTFDEWLHELGSYENLPKPFPKKDFPVCDKLTVDLRKLNGANSAKYFGALGVVETENLTVVLNPKAASQSSHSRDFACSSPGSHLLVTNSLAADFLQSNHDHLNLISKTSDHSGTYLGYYKRVFCDTGFEDDFRSYEPEVREEIFKKFLNREGRIGERSWEFFGKQGWSQEEVDDQIKSPNSSFYRISPEQVVRSGLEDGSLLLKVAIFVCVGFDQPFFESLQNLNSASKSTQPRQKIARLTPPADPFNDTPLPPKPVRPRKPRSSPSKPSRKQLRISAHPTGDLILPDLSRFEKLPFVNGTLEKFDLIEEDLSSSASVLYARVDVGTGDFKCPACGTQFENKQAWAVRTHWNRQCRKRWFIVCEPGHNTIPSKSKPGIQFWKVPIEFVKTGLGEGFSVDEGEH